MAILGFVNLVRSGYRKNLIFAAALPIIVYALITATIWSTRITVTTTGIAFQSFFVRRKFVSFKDIDHSDVQVLAEREHPAFCSVYYQDGAEIRVLLLNLKPYRKEDVAWFCALPELRTVTHPGFTRT